ncbi:serine hydrolase domain-containing protein [Niveispirillum fermenti]|uniref:serine hydrolase domain-containing protein n=1 Tax=Niveispirillum fermenti TaxID=1233113 RepID=UPI003A87FFF8
MPDDPAIIHRRHLLQDGAACILGLGLGMGMVATARPARASGRAPALAGILEAAGRLEPLETVIVARNGAVLAERGYNGHSPAAPTNIKSASKTVITALVGMAIDRGALAGVDQPIAGILRDQIPDKADPRIEQVTIGHLLSMQAGLGPTSGPNYGRWVGSRNWVRAALDQPFADDPGGRMLYSTGSSHLLSAILTRVTGRSTRENARRWFADVDGFAIGGWQRDPQGIYMGGNEMAMSPRSLLAFGEIYRTGGRTADGRRVLSRDWIIRSWQPRTRSAYTGDGYGYGWFLRRMGGEDMAYAWGYGGQMLYIVPRLGLSVVMTSDNSPRPTTIADRDNLHTLMGRIIAAFQQAGEDS